MRRTMTLSSGAKVEMHLDMIKMIDDAHRAVGSRAENR